MSIVVLYVSDVVDDACLRGVLLAFGKPSKLKRASPPGKPQLGGYSACDLTRLRRHGMLERLRIILESSRVSHAAHTIFPLTRTSTIPTTPQFDLSSASNNLLLSLSRKYIRI